MEILTVEEFKRRKDLIDAHWRGEQLEFIPRHPEWDVRADEEWRILRKNIEMDWSLFDYRIKLFMPTAWADHAIIWVAHKNDPACAVLVVEISTTGFHTANTSYTWHDVEMLLWSPDRKDWKPLH